VGSEICVCISCLTHCKVTKAIGGHFKHLHKEYGFTQEKHNKTKIKIA
jgi:hypothetical protein